MDKPFSKEYVGFFYARKGQLYHSLVLSEKAEVEWERLGEEGCEIIYTEELERIGEIKYFLVRGAHFAEVWAKLAS